MPTYQYACTTCGEQLEAVQRFTDDPLTECPHCAGRLRKVFSPVGVVFKGSGFYRTDSRSAARSGASSNGAAKHPARSNGSGDAGTADSGSSDKASSSASGGDTSHDTSGASKSGAKAESTV